MIAMRQRGNIEQTINLLQAIKDFPNHAKYRIAAIAGLNYPKACSIIIRLEKQELISYNDISKNKRWKGIHGKILSITPKGRAFLTSAKKLMENGAFQ